ncbi:hypothetical protein K2173_026182 [Erythroxylum novogranatense]|uniref:Subtilisin-like protease SBT1.9 n=1 Tax=Erythroxylum novogranatense TaxID=1862640 RepID=A0AAV8T8Z6_9ROSI|nr:hypothetical protein K2173_026182 [Erythroxylum novogranatense]
MAIHCNSNGVHVWFCFIICVSYFVPSLTQTDNYIVHMDLSAMPKAYSGKHGWFFAILSSVLDDSSSRSSTSLSTISSSKLLYSYDHVINGFSASLTPSELEALKGSPGYISSIKDLPVKKDTTHSTKFLGLTPNSGAWKVSNFGEDVIIGVVDTGVWPESESYKDDGMPEVPKRWKGVCESGTQFNSSMCNRKLIGARAFNRGLAAKFPNITISMNSTRDVEGHGTHTSSTAAGNFVQGASYFDYAPGTASGVAPKAHVAMYKALFDEGSFTSDIIAAIDQAINDGVDVLSISLGLDGVVLYEDPIALATFKAVEKNIFVSTSAGNEGPFIASLHNGTPWVLTVAAGTMDRDFGAVLTLGNGVSVTGSSLYPGNFSASPVPIMFMDACLSLNELKKVGKKIVVCQDKNDSLSDQINNVRNAHVAGGIFITNLTENEFFLQNSFPAIFMNPKEGETIKDYIKSSSKPQGSMEFRKTYLGTRVAPSVTSYTSRGPSSSCPYVLKPDIMGPGAQILAAWPQNISVTEIDSRPLFNNFNLLSGTSMSCPHLAGVAALLKKAHPEWSPAAIRSAMMTTADTTSSASDQPIKDNGFDNQAATPIAMGAGQVNPSKALDPGLVYDLNSSDYVKLLCALNFTEKQIQSITGSPTNDCTNPSLDLNYPSFIAFFKADGPTIQQEFHRTVTNVGKGTSTYAAILTGLAGIKARVVPEKLEFKDMNEKLTYTLVIEGPGQLAKGKTIYGYLSWVDSKGHYSVKSPIVATTLKPDDLSS